LARNESLKDSLFAESGQKKFDTSVGKQLESIRESHESKFDDQIKESESFDDDFGQTNFSYSQTRELNPSGMPNKSKFNNAHNKQLEGLVSLT
jgi:hypothetical protein